MEFQTSSKESSDVEIVELNINQKKSRVKFKSRDIFSKSLLIMITLFGLMTIAEIIILTINFSYFIKELINPPSWWGGHSTILTRYISWYNLIPFFGFILFFTSIMKSYDSLPVSKQKTFMTISRLFFFSSIIFLLLAILQLLDRIGFFLPTDMNLFTGGFLQRTLITSIIFLVIYFIGFSFQITGLIMLSKSNTRKEKSDQKLISKTKIFMGILVGIEFLHLLYMVICNLIAGAVPNTLFFIGLLILVLTPFFYFIVLISIFTNRTEIFSVETSVSNKEKEKAKSL